MITIGGEYIFLDIPCKTTIYIDEPPQCGVIVAALQIVQSGFGVEVVASIAEGVDGGDVDGFGFAGCGGGGIIGNGAGTPCIVGVTGYGFAALVGDGDYVTLQVFQEVVGNIAVENAADVVLVVIERNQGIAVPILAQNLGTVQSKAVLDPAYGFGSADTAGVVGVQILVLAALNSLELSALFPDQSAAQIAGGVALLLFSVYRPFLQMSIY